MATSTSASTTACQNGSNSSRPGEREPPKPGTGAGRMSTTLAPRSTHPLQLLDRLLDDRQADDRRGEDPVLVVEGPLSWSHWLSEWITTWISSGSSRSRSSSRLASVGNIRDRSMPCSSISWRRGAGLAEGGDAPHRLADELPVRLALRVAVPEVVLLGPGPGHDLEGRVRDVLADRALDDDLGAAVEVDVVHCAPVPVGQVPGEGVLGLVEVVVGVEDREVQRASHGPTIRSL